ncbi:hypothetical protein J2X83_004590 [Brevibacillus nitrificans]|nr:hypothetical protein [Brevibacillus nitrificans]
MGIWLKSFYEVAINDLATNKMSTGSVNCYYYRNCSRNVLLQRPGVEMRYGLFYCHNDNLGGTIGAQVF